MNKKRILPIQLLLVLLLLCTFSPLHLCGAEPAKPAAPAAVTAPAAPASPAASALIIPDAPAYSKGTVTVSPFASYRAHEFGKFNGKFGGGIALSYFPVDNVAVELETLSEGFGSHLYNSFTEAGANLKGYIPIGSSGFAPYFLAGYTRGGLDGIESTDNRINVGAGVEWHASKRFGLFADGRWTHDFETLGHSLFRLGGNVSF